MIAYSYRRFSSLAQADGDSLRRQTELAEKYASEHNLELDTTLVDMGVSAFTGANVESGNLGTFIRAIDSGLVKRGSYLLVESLDRITRESVINALELFLSIIRRGITIVTLIDKKEYSEKSITNNFTELIISIVILSRAHEESQTKSFRRVEAWKSAIEKYKLTGERITARCPFWLELNDDRKSFTVREEQANAVRAIFDLCNRGYGALKIIYELEKIAIPPYKGETWVASTINDILVSKAPIGTLVIKEQELEGYYPAIIDKELFWAVQAKRGTRKGGRISRKRNLFSSVLTCGYCRGTMLVETTKTHAHISCKNARYSKKVCSVHYWRYEQFEDLFFRFVQSDLDFSSVFESKVDVVEGKLKELDEKISNLLRLAESGSLTITNRLLELESERSKITQKPQTNIDILSRNWESLKSSERLQDVEVRIRLNQLIRSVIEEIVVFPIGNKEGTRPNTRAYALGLHTEKHFIVKFRSGVRFLVTPSSFERWTSSPR